MSADEIKTYANLLMMDVVLKERDEAVARAERAEAALADAERQVRTSVALFNEQVRFRNDLRREFEQQRSTVGRVREIVTAATEPCDDPECFSHDRSADEVFRAILAALDGTEEQRPAEHGDQVCAKCGAVNIVWFTPDNELWNFVEATAGKDVLCVTCFVRIAEDVLTPVPPAWMVMPEPRPEFDGRWVWQSAQRSERSEEPKSSDEEKES